MCVCVCVFITSREKQGGRGEGGGGGEGYACVFMCVCTHSMRVRDGVESVTPASWAHVCASVGTGCFSLMVTPEALGV